MTAAAVVDFDEATHRYSVNGITFPSVTQALESSGISDFSGVNEDVLKRAAQRGTAVHNACWYDDQNDLDESSVAVEIQGYLEAWRAFRRNTGFIPDEIEKTGHCPIYKYCGRFDRNGTFSNGRAATVDIKTGAEQPSWPIQLAGYSRLQTKPMSRDRVAVKLSADGTYRTIIYPLNEFKRDEAIFLSAVGLWWWKKENGLL